MLKDHDFVNVLNHFPGKSKLSKSAKFPMAEARTAAKSLLELLRNRTVVLCGKNVAAAFGLEKFQYFVKYQFRSDTDSLLMVPTVVVIPHASGKAILWNNPEFVDYARKFLTNLIHEGE
jgi:hypothetical protein